MEEQNHLKLATLLFKLKDKATDDTDDTTYRVLIDKIDDVKCSPQFQICKGCCNGTYNIVFIVESQNIGYCAHSDQKINIYHKMHRLKNNKNAKYC